MEFSYTNLKDASKNGMRIGNWRDKGVFACSESELKNKGSGAYYIVYDDNNTLISKVGDRWYKFGIVSKEGTVHECDACRYTYHYDTQAYEPAAPKKKEKAPEKKEVQKPQAAAHDAPIGDVQLGLEVDATLKRARTMTVESLLEGFNYGLT
jgi:hypothetical protein